jgi:hypothetical protein
MSHRELKKLVEYLQPKKKFPYGIQILRCFIIWSKYTTSVGSNLGFLSSNSNNIFENEFGNSNLVTTASTNNILMPEVGHLDTMTKLKQRSSSLTINQTALLNMLRTTGTGALSANAQQQAKYFFDFQHSNSVCS